jgi:hypothetical protein
MEKYDNLPIIPLFKDYNPQTIKSSLSGTEYQQKVESTFISLADIVGPDNTKFGKTRP